jgi:hypothetical protein
VPADGFTATKLNLKPCSGCHCMRTPPNELKASTSMSVIWKFSSRFFIFEFQFIQRMQ